MPENLKELMLPCEISFINPDDKYLSNNINQTSHNEENVSGSTCIENKNRVINLNLEEDINYNFKNLKENEKKENLLQSKISFVKKSLSLLFFRA